MKKLFFTILTFAIFVFFYYLYNTFFIARVVSNSMKPLFSKGDLIIYTKNIKKIKRNDVILFRNNEGILVIKRCLGLPKDTISIIGDSIFINRFTSENELKLYVEKTYFRYSKESTYRKYSFNITPHKGLVIKKNLKKIYFTKDKTDLYCSRDSCFFKNDFYFVIGDNRMFSVDSRYYGSISKGKIVGKFIFKL